MRLELPENAVHNPLVIMRRAGYSAFTDPVTKDESFILRLTKSFYPRFHVYVDHKGQKVIFDIHLDQKQPSYGQGHAHAGEYDGPTVEHEVKRVASWANAVMREENAKLSKEYTEEHDEESAKEPKKWTSWFWT